MTEATAKTLLKEHYGIEGELKALQAYASKNFLVTTGSEKYILKLYADLEQSPLVRAENDLLLHIHRKDPSLRIPLPIASIEGTYHVEGSDHIIRLLSYLEGTFVAETGYSPETLTLLGEYLARLDRALLHYVNPVYSARIYEWNIQQFFLAEKKLTYLKDPAERSLLKYFFLQYRENVVPKAHELRQAIIHNDGHEWNFLLADRTTPGIIDFGDTVHAPLIQDLAVAVTYALMGSGDFEAVMPLVRAYHQVLPLKEEEVALLHYFIGARVAISLCMSAHARTLEPDNQYLTISEKPGWKLLHRLIRIGPVQAQKLFLEACGYPQKTDSPLLEQDLNRRHSYLGGNLSLSYATPIKMEKAAFQYMYDSRGKAYLDCVNNIFHVGHGHPRIVETAQRQMARLNTNTRYLYDELLRYSERLLNKFDHRLNKVFLVNSGSAATDLALRLARNFTGSPRTLVMDHGYHGNTTAAIEVSPYKFNGRGGMGKADQILIAPLASSPEMDRTLGQVKETVEQGDQVGSFIAESIVGCGGQVPLPAGYLEGLCQLIKEQGGVYIADEVQTGFGRVGTHFWAYESLRGNPDLVVLGKPMGNGHPIGAVVTTTEIAEAFDNGMEFFSSFGGNPVSCAIGLAVLEVIEAEGLQEQALVVGNDLQQQLEGLQERFDVISEVRGSGLFLGIEFMKDQKPLAELTSQVVNQLKEESVLLSIDGPHHNVIKIKPPLCFHHENVLELTSKLERSLSHLKD